MADDVGLRSVTLVWKRAPPTPATLPATGMVWKSEAKLSMVVPRRVFCATSGAAKRSTAKAIRVFLMVVLLRRSASRQERVGDVRLRRQIDSAVALQQSVVRRRQ